MMIMGKSFAWALSTSLRVCIYQSRGKVYGDTAAMRRGAGLLTRRTLFYLLAVKLGLAQLIY